MRVFRSLLYAPADRPDLIAAAEASATDAIILDLEDRVADDRKALARAAARETVDRLGRERIVYVRVNALDSGLTRDDLAAIVAPGLEGIRVPKVDSVATIAALDVLLVDAEAAAGVAPGTVRLSLGLETAAAVADARALCAASPRISCVAAGLGRGGDLQRDVGFLPGDDLATLYIRSKVVLDARAAGVPIPLDGGYGTYARYDPATEEAAFLASARLGRRLGYRAKITFHAAQVDAINRIFGDEEEPAP